MILRPVLRGGPVAPIAILLAVLAVGPRPAFGQGDAESPIAGLDVSHFSGTVDWSEVAEAGYRFAYVKATEGVDSADPRFATNWSGLAAADLPRGAYHFYVTEDDPDEQARFFLDTVDFAAGDLVPAVDIETLGKNTQPGLVDRLRRFLDAVEQAVGAKPLIYTSTRFWNAHLDASFGEYPLWIAEYEVEAPSLPEGWDQWTIWQFADSDSIPGVENDADRDRLRVGLSVDDLRLPQADP